MNFNPPKELVSIVKSLCKKKLNVWGALELLVTVSKDFRKIAGSTSDFIYRSRKLGVVVKRPALCNIEIPTSKYFLPTKVYSIKYEDNYLSESALYFHYWFIQPICDVSKKARIKAEQFFEKEEDLCEKYCDLGGHNVGLYQDKPVFFDF